MKKRSEHFYEMIVKGFCLLVLLAFGAISLWSFDKLPQKDKDFIILMLMMGQQQ